MAATSEDRALVQLMYQHLCEGENILRIYEARLRATLPTLLPAEKEWADHVLATASHFAAAHLRFNFIQTRVVALCNVECLGVAFDDLRESLRQALNKFRDMSNDDFDDWSDEDEAALIADDFSAWRRDNEDELNGHFRRFKNQLEDIQNHFTEVVKVINLFC
jgi:hypothetical protein